MGLNDIKVEPNPKANQTIGERILDYTGKANGAFRTLDTAHRVLQTVNTVQTSFGKEPILPDVQSNLGTAKRFLAIPYLPTALNNAKEAIDEVKKEDPSSPAFGRKAAVAFRNTAEAVAISGYAANLILKNPTLQTAASAFELANDTADVGIRARDIVSCNQMLQEIERNETAAAPEKRATDEVKEAVANTKTFSILRLIKAVCGVVGAIFGLAMLSAGVATSLAWAPIAIALVLISLASTATAISSEWYRDSRSFNPVNL